ncbi:hypothetical protein B0T14DRAFT_522632 [Immersiella caudata]|uniref:Zn(2)-C6 fungal-type domain-containing protein n=1 Tax=Immersiella caudata TaxID=314043 RepID=A0AA40BWI6_9PEZI|nr:hypothetical protein B0T14DRAFT_522632 [Immersiella caudata]
MEPLRKRRRPAVSCSQCRSRKVKCNRENPCSNCEKLSNNTVCDYTDVHAQARTAHRTAISNVGPDAQSQTAATRKQPGASRVSAPPPSTRPGASPAFSSASTAASPVVATAAFTGLGDAFYVHYEQESVESLGAGAPLSQSIPRFVAHKTRLFGQSHWVSPCITLFRDLIHLMGRSVNTLAYAEIERCKSLARLIKARRSPPWPTAPTRELPSRDVADVLVDRYFQTTETLYRVLHIPSFRKSYSALREQQPGVREQQADMGFIIQVKLVLAIGATTYDDDFSLRTMAIGWVHEALTWNSSPVDAKSRLTIQGIQNHILLLIAQDLVGVGRSMVWPSTGALVRTAMHMGLHRDPSRLQPSATLFAAEMRRRLWNTILELVVQSSLGVGGAPLLSLSEFDTLPPSNYCDDDLCLTFEKPPSSQPLTTLTETTVAIAFRQTLPVRLSIACHLNSLSSPSPTAPYCTTLDLDEALRSAYLGISQGLRMHGPSFGVLYLDLLVHRYLAALHVPFLASALSLDPARAGANTNNGDNANNCNRSKFLFSRNSALSATLRVWAASTASSSPLFTRFVTNGTTFLRASSAQAIFVIAAELRAQLLAELSSLVPTPVIVRPDLAKVLEEAEDWALRCINAGETNVKGYLFVCLIRAQIEAMRARLAEDEVPGVLSRVIEEAGAECVRRLEQILGSLPQSTQEGDDKRRREWESPNTPSGDNEIDWLGSFFSFEDAELLSCDPF